MNKRQNESWQRLPFLAAVGAALLGAVLMQSHLARQRARPEEEARRETYRIAVAARDLDAAHEIVPEDVAFEDIRMSRLPRHIYSAGLSSELTRSDHENSSFDAVKAELSGRRLVGTLRRGDMLLATDFDTETQISLGGALGSFQRAVSVTVDRDSVMGGLLLPNDRVDVVVRYPVTIMVQGTSHTVASKTEVLLQNVTVLAVGGRLSRLDAERSSGGGSTSVVLALTPDQALRLSQVQSGAQLSLLLRPNGRGAEAGDYQETVLVRKNNDLEPTIKGMTEDHAKGREP